jgi:hypothetical protein
MERRDLGVVGAAAAHLEGMAEEPGRGLVVEDDLAAGRLRNQHADGHLLDDRVEQGMLVFEPCYQRLALGLGLLACRDVA